MQNNQKVKRVQLDVKQLNDFHLFGIVTTEPDYKLSLALNKKFRISLKNIPAVEVLDEGTPVLTFSRFSNSGCSSCRVFSLISNRSGKQFLLKKLTNIDYILQVQDTDNINNAAHLTESLREIESVNAVFKLDISTIRDKNLRYLIQ